MECGIGKGEINGLMIGYLILCRIGGENYDRHVSLLDDSLTRRIECNGLKCEGKFVFFFFFFFEKVFILSQS